jgi:hypothetical protein
VPGCPASAPRLLPGKSRAPIRIELRIVVPLPITLRIPMTAA